MKKIKRTSQVLSDKLINQFKKIEKTINEDNLIADKYINDMIIDYLENRNVVDITTFFNNLDKKLKSDNIIVELEEAILNQQNDNIQNFNLFQFQRRNIDLKNKQLLLDYISKNKLNYYQKYLRIMEVFK